MSKYISFILACILLPLQVAFSKSNLEDTTPGIVSENEMTDFRNTGPIVYTQTTYEGLQTLRKGHADKAYALWVEQGFKGDINALALAAMLCKMEEIKPSTGWRMRFGKDKDVPPPPVCPVPAEFWENSLITMLGEGEATLLLGLFGMELMEYDPHRQMMAYAPYVEDYLLRSALAGNPDGMYGAYLTGENRKINHFEQPKNMPNVPVLPQKFMPHTTKEGQHWLTYSAHAGNIWAMESIAWQFRGTPPAVQPDKEQMARYYNMAVNHGSYKAAGILGLLYGKGKILPQNCPKAVYYSATSVRLREKGKIVFDDKAQYPLGNNLRIMKEGYMEGDLTFGGEVAVTTPCLTEQEFNKALEQSWKTYQMGMAVRQKEQTAHDALYKSAREQLPDIKAAYEQAITAATR